eukprot:2204094-Pyramimonas_sp.AAC.1
MIKDGPRDGSLGKCVHPFAVTGTGEPVTQGSAVDKGGPRDGSLGCCVHPFAVTGTGCDSKIRR